MPKQNLVNDRAELVNLLARLERTKNQAHIQALRRAFKLLKELDLSATTQGFKSPLLMLRKEVLETVKKKTKKGKTK